MKNQIDYIQNHKLEKNVGKFRITLRFWVNHWGYTLVYVEKYLANKRVKYKELDLKEFDNCIKNGGFFGFEKQEIFDFMQKHNSEIIRIRKEDREAHIRDNQVSAETELYFYHRK